MFKSRCLQLLLLLLLPILSLRSGSVHPEEVAKSEEESEPRSDGEQKAVSVAAEYVRANLQEYLNAKKIKFHKDGRVTMTFNFRKRNAVDEEIFSPKIATKVKNRFRWTVRSERPRGIRLGDRGLALFGCWFKADVSAEIEYAQGSNFQQRHTAALIFYSDKRKRAVGNNYGTQCVQFRDGKLAGVKGEVEEIVRKKVVKIRLAVKDGEFKAYKNGRLKSSATYKEKDMTSGRVGFLWNGGVAGVVKSLTITGDLDAEKMLTVLRKSNRN